MSEIHEMKSLTLKDETFNSFLDQQAREDLKKKLPLPDGTAKVGQYLRVLSVDEAGKITDVETVDATPGSGGNANQGGLSTTEANLLITILRNAVYSSDQSENITALETALASSGSDSGGSGDSGEDSGETEVTLSSISATYSGGDVAVGTAVTALTGIVVKATYSDGSTKTVTGYTLSGTIAEGSNTITVSYGGKTTTFTVTGVAESGGETTTSNLYDGSYVIGILNNGSLNTASTAARTTDFMDCAGLSAIYTLIVKSGVVKSYYRVIEFYDADKTYISKGTTTSGAENGITPTETIEPISVPSNAAYVRVTFAIVYCDDGTSRYVGASATPDTSEFVAATTLME